MENKVQPKIVAAKIIIWLSHFVDLSSKQKTKNKPTQTGAKENLYWLSLSNTIV